MIRIFGNFPSLGLLVINSLCYAYCQCTYFSFQLIVEVRIIKLNKTEEQGPFLGNGVISGNLLLHILLQECHVAQETTRKGPQQLKQQLNLRIVAPVE